MSDTLILQNLTENTELCQWMINDDIIGAVEDTLIVLPEGQYTISLSCSNGDCIDVAVDSIAVVLIGLEAQRLKSWNLYPNPNNGVFKIVGDEALKIESVRVLDLYGNQVYKEKLLNASSSLQVQTELVPGIYLVEIISEGVIQSKRIIIQ